ncbi:MAG: isoamylase early set domain-containing protein [candidate division NC10 bacterium]|nr:isoamylase early set domain-containing protein [candidate division NC10 bacterium]
MIEWDGRVVTFHLTGVEADEAFLVGDFNGWNERAHPMRQVGDRQWVLKMDLPPGEYEFQYLVDGVWHNDSEA